jgi:hypothetical protein
VLDAPVPLVLLLPLVVAEAPALEHAKTKPDIASTARRRSMTMNFLREDHEDSSRIASRRLLQSLSSASSATIRPIPMEPNPYAPPSQEPSTPGASSVPLTPPLHRFTSQNAKKEVWTISIHSDRVALIEPNGRMGRSFDRQDFVAQTSFLFLSPPHLVVPKPPPPISLPLAPEALAALRTWLEPVLRQHLSRALAQLRASALVIGVLRLLPVGKTGVSPLGVVFGLSWLAWAAAATFAPHRILLLVNAVLWSIAGVAIAIGAYQGTTPRFMLVFLPFFVPMILIRFRSHRFYAPLA